MTTTLTHRVSGWGDSITAQASPNNYLEYLYQMLVEADYNVAFVGQVNGPVPIFHEGYPGAEIVDLDPAEYVAANPPDIIIPHIGTNDIASEAVDGAGALLRLEALLEEIYDVAPWALVIVPKIIPFGAEGLYAALDAEREIYDDGIDTVVMARVAAGQRVVSVDFATDYDPDWYQPVLIDDSQLHPNEDGARFMAAQAYPAVVAEIERILSETKLARGFAQRLLGDALRFEVLLSGPRTFVLPSRGHYHLLFTKPSRFKQGSPSVAVSTTTGTPALEGQWWPNVRVQGDEDRFFSVVATDEDGFVEAVRITKGGG